MLLNYEKDDELPFCTILAPRCNVVAGSRREGALAALFLTGSIRGSGVTIWRANLGSTGAGRRAPAGALQEEATATAGARAWVEAHRGRRDSRAEHAGAQHRESRNPRLGLRGGGVLFHGREAQQGM